MLSEVLARKNFGVGRILAVADAKLARCASADHDLSEHVTLITLLTDTSSSVSGQWSVVKSGLICSIYTMTRLAPSQSFKHAIMCSAADYANPLRTAASAFKIDDPAAPITATMDQYNY